MSHSARSGCRGRHDRCADRRDVCRDACNTFAAALTPFGVDLSPLTLGCAAVVNGQGSLLLTALLSAPQHACIALAGVTLANNPTVLMSCNTFAAALAPYTSYVAGLIPPSP